MEEFTQAEIIVVEDNDSDAELTYIALNNCLQNCKIQRLYDGEEATDFFKTWSINTNREKKVLPDLILLDFNLPKVNGIEVLKRIKNNEWTKQIPVVMMASSKTQNDIQLIFKSGADSYIEKSIFFEKFFKEIEHACEVWLK